MLTEDLDPEEWARRRNLEQALRMSEPWSVVSVLETLVVAYEHLYEIHDCDHHGYEDWHHAAEAARDILKRLSADETPCPRTSPD